MTGVPRPIVFSAFLWGLFTITGAMDYHCQIEEEWRQPYQFICDLRQLALQTEGPSSSLSDGRPVLKVDTLSAFLVVVNDTLIYTRSTLDREALHRQDHCDVGSWHREREACVLVVEVADIRNAQSPRFFVARILVNDVNDHAPDFGRQSMFLLRVRENEPANTVLDLPVATDLDRGNNGSVSYRLEGPGSSGFRLVPNERNDRLQLKTTQSFDREKTSEFHFQLIATDAGQPVARSSSLSLDILIDEVNEDAPMFSQSTFDLHIPENTSVGVMLKQLTATDTDKDSHVTISMGPAPNSARFANVFHVDSEGKVTLKRPLDYEDPEDRFFDIPLLAVDNGQPPKTGTAQLKVFVTDVNDGKPKIDIRSLKSQRGSTFSVQENLPTDAFVAKVSVTDADSGEFGQVECRLEQGSAEFVLHKSSLSGGSSGSSFATKNKQDYQLQTAMTFDRELKEQYTVSITCNDRAPVEARQSSIREITVFIEDANDNGPIFQYSLALAELRENQPVGTQVARLVTTDLDKEANAITHYEIPSAYAHLVEVNRFTGVVVARQSFDRELNRTIQFQAIAYDSLNMSMNATVNYTVQISDENDNPPLFTQEFHFSVMETQTAQVGQVNATDADEGMNAKITFHLSDSYPQRNLWTVHSNGYIFVTSGRHLDRETQNLYLLPIVASDSGRHSLSSTATVTITVLDINDWAPEFLDPPNGRGSVNISRSTAVGTVVFRLRAMDRDMDENARLTFYNAKLTPSTSRPGVEENYFSVNSTTGEIKLARPLPSDSQYSKLPNLIIVAEDHGAQRRSSSALLEVHLVTEDLRSPNNRDNSREAQTNPLVDPNGYVRDPQLMSSISDSSSWTKKVLIVLMVAFIALLMVLIVAGLLYFFFGWGRPAPVETNNGALRKKREESLKDKSDSSLWCGTCRGLLAKDDKEIISMGKDNGYSIQNGPNVPLPVVTVAASRDESREMGQLLQRLPSIGYEAISGGGSMYQGMPSEPSSAGCPPVHAQVHIHPGDLQRNFRPNELPEGMDNYWMYNNRSAPPQMRHQNAYDLAGEAVWTSAKKRYDRPSAGNNNHPPPPVKQNNCLAPPGQVGYTPSGDTLHSATSDEVRGIFYSSTPSHPLRHQQFDSNATLGGPGLMTTSSSGRNGMAVNHYPLDPNHARSHSLNNPASGAGSSAWTSNPSANFCWQQQKHPQQMSSASVSGLHNSYLKPIAASNEALAAPSTGNAGDKAPSDKGDDNQDRSSAMLYSTYGTTGRSNFLVPGPRMRSVPPSEERFQHSRNPQLLSTISQDDGDEEAARHREQRPTTETEGFLTRSGYVKGAPCYSSSFV